MFAGSFCQLYKITAVGVLVVRGNVSIGQTGFMTPNYYFMEFSMAKFSFELIKVIGQ